MPAFLVDPNAVADASLRLGSVPRGVQDIHGQLGRHVGAAAGTPASGAIDDLLSRFSEVMPQFALAGAHLSRAVYEAAREYHASDQSIAQAASEREQAGSEREQAGSMRGQAASERAATDVQTRRS